MTNTTDSSVPGHSIWNFYLGLVLALLSTLFIGCSFIIKKIALIRLEKYGTRACDGGYGYLRDWLWWLGLILIGVGEGSNFVAYAFAPASLVTPLGGLSVLVTAIMSSKFLQEHLNLIGKIGCVVCLSGSTIIVLHAPKEQEIESMADLTKKFLNPAYITYACMIVLLVLVLIFYLGPKFGKTNPLIYLSISGMIGSLSVMACKGIGVGIREAILDAHATLWSPLFWVLIIQLVASIMVQMNFLNMALDIFNTNIVTPVLYVIFTGSVLIASSLLFQEWSALTLEDHFGNICGLLCIVSGIFLITAFRELDVSWNTIRKSLKAGSSNRYSEKEAYFAARDTSYMSRTPNHRFLHQHTRAFSDQSSIQHRLNERNNNAVPEAVLQEDASQKPGFFSSPWKRFYGSTQAAQTTHRRAYSIDSRKSYDSDPESGSQVRLLAANELEQPGKPTRFLHSLSPAKSSSVPLRSHASSSNGSSSPNHQDSRAAVPPIAMVKPTHLE